MGKTVMIAERVQRLRDQMKKAGVHAYLVPSSDPHQNESVPPCWRRREWISGFRGSAGTVVVTQDRAALWTDGRYHLQAQEELDPRVFTLFPLGVPGVRELHDWLAEELPEGAVVGVDPRLLSVEEAKRLEDLLRDSGKGLRYLEENLVDRIWEDRPPLPLELIRIHPLKFTGESVASKLARLREEMTRRGADVHVLGALDAVAWLFNLRGRDIPYSPVFISYALITRDEAFLFVEPRKLHPQIKEALGDNVLLRPYEDFERVLARWASQRARIWIDPQRTSRWVLQKVEAEGRPLLRESPLFRLKAMKNPVELRGMRACHLRDGAALVRFLHWLYEEVPKGKVTECSAARTLESFRSEMDYWQGPSFETIVAYNAHGAVIHYTPTPRTDVPLAPEGLLLVDSGGHYLDGTTDVTRTVALGPPSPEQRRRFTLVLKGHIRLARTRFPRGTPGRQLDALARTYLWEEDLDYRHGTGHGVGAYLNVHEAPPSLSPKGDGTPLEPGMVVSNEPGYYEEGRYGIRIESMMEVVEDPKSGSSPYGPFYKFEVMTLAPIDRRLVDPRLLTPDERIWLNSYHARVREALTPLLDQETRQWLAKATEPL
jgi:Xaa-Pro aminopeptidase